MCVYVCVCEGIVEKFQGKNLLPLNGTFIIMPNFDLVLQEGLNIAY